jgi:fructokinase
MHNKIKHTKICIGTGLIALDVILNGKPETPPKLHAGGSCGNVLSILAYLGWSSYPIARLAKNIATKEIVCDFKKWEVNTSLITKTDDGSTPIIIHRILKDKFGIPKHKFEFKDPETKTWLPQYKPVLNKEINSIFEKQPKANVFYFDRISRGAIELAKANKANGAIIFFEPSSIGDNNSIFNECLHISDVVKFSSDRIPDYANMYSSQQVPLEIETKGKEGLRFRYSRTKQSKVWHTIKAFKINEVHDAAGAGDWCSSGIIDKLCRKGMESFKTSDLADIKSAITYGQLLGALNCSFDGARGIMYSVEKSALDQVIKKTLYDDSYDLTKIQFKNTSSRLNRKPIQISKLYT